MYFEETYHLDQVQVSCGNLSIPTATVRITGPEGEGFCDADHGTGPVDAVYRAINRVNGEPCCASPTLLLEILRQEWGFGGPTGSDGYVVSDCKAIRDIYEHHKVVETAAEAATLAVKHGCDLNCGSVYPSFWKPWSKS